MFKDEKKYEEIANVFKALTNPIRLKILDVLISNCKKSECCCVTEINYKIDLPQPYISKHLKILSDSGILEYKRDGNKIYYSFKKTNRNELKHILGFLEKCCKCC